MHNKFNSVTKSLFITSIDLCSMSSMEIYLIDNIDSMIR